jgi:hypothetical protein
MKSLRTLDLQEIKKYVHYLGILAIACIVMRIFWVFDIMLAVKKAVRDQNNHNSAKTGDNAGTGTGTGDSGSSSSTDQQQLNKDAVTSFTIQVLSINPLVWFHFH